MRMPELTGANNPESTGDTQTFYPLTVVCLFRFVRPFLAQIRSSVMQVSSPATAI